MVLGEHGHEALQVRLLDNPTTFAWNCFTQLLALLYEKNSSN